MGRRKPWLMFSVLKTPASSAVGRAAHPSRHPVMANPLEWPLAMTVRLAMPSQEATLECCSPSKRIHS